jgi:hypothetical protein
VCITTLSISSWFYHGENSLGWLCLVNRTTIKVEWQVSLVILEFWSLLVRVVGYKVDKYLNLRPDEKIKGLRVKARPWVFGGPRRGWVEGALFASTGINYSPRPRKLIEMTFTATSKRGLWLSGASAAAPPAPPQGQPWVEYHRIGRMRMNKKIFEALRW